MKRALNWKSALTGSAILILTVAAILFLPRVFTSPEKMTIRLTEELVLPELNGPFQVGRTTIYIVNKDQPALPGLKNPREWVVTIFYPADPESNATPGPYAEEPLKTAYTNYSLTKESDGALDHIHSHSYWNAAVDRFAGKFPVLLFSPGGGEQPLFYTSLLEQISSFGYIVVAIPDPFDTPVIPLPDGRILTSDQITEWCQQDETCKKAMAGDKAAMQEFENVMRDYRAKDMIFTLSQLEKINQENPILAGVMNLEKVGVFGHSYGGASATRLAQLDDRVGAVAVLDSDIFLVIQKDSKPLTQSVLFMTTANIDVDTQELEQINLRNALSNAYLSQSSSYYYLTIAGTTHQSIQSDAMFLAPYISIGGQGVILNASNTTPARITYVISTYIVAFFDQHIKGIEQPLLSEPSDAYPEITIDAKQ